MGVVLPEKGFLNGLRSICSREKILLILDEVITGFRVAFGGAQELYGIRADLTTLGKVIGGGLPVGAYGGKKEIMEMVAPQGPVYQAGTLSGNPLAMAAGYETLKMLSERKSVYGELEKKGQSLVEAIEENIRRLDLPVTINRIGSMFTLFFTERKVIDYSTARTSDTRRFAAFFRAMLEKRIYLPPSQFEAAFLSIAHSWRDIEKTIAASGRAMAEAFSPQEK